mmetsp:Transcript_5510/g.9365  ORF Transcript_5510/g.9365 Transcript_5510/m.9365 type:complete len:346 (-) Transcript_5510:50-1087(-)
MEYYTHISCSVDKDSYFDLMITNAWQLDGGSNPASMPYAGSQKKVAHVNARESYKQDHHRNLFGTDNKTVWNKSKKVGDQWQSTSKTSMGGVDALGIQSQSAAGSYSYYNQDGYKKNELGSTRDTGAGYQGMKHSGEELIEKLREKLAARGARGMIGIQRVFKILDDDRSGLLDIQEFWKGLCDFRLKFSQEECRKLFDMFDNNGDERLDIDEFIQTIKGPMTPARKEIVKKAFKKVDVNGNGLVETDDIKAVYNSKSHPDVLSGRKTEQEVIQEFIETFEAHGEMAKEDQASKRGDGIVTLKEFIDYYSNVSASIENDEYFQLMISQAWNLDNKGYKRGLAMEY